MTVLDANGLIIGDMDLVSDRAGGLHLFISIGGRSEDPREPRPPNVVLYTQNTGEGWSEPVDVVINSDPTRFNGPGGVAAAADGRRRLHLVMSIAPLQYWYADIHNAKSARGWQKARSGPWNVIGVDARLFVDSQDTVHLLYSDTSGYAYYTHSKDGGVTWSESVQVSQTNTFDRYADRVDLVVDEKGRIHAIWNETVSPQGYPPAGVYYAYSDDEGQSWSVPVELGGMYSNAPAITAVGDHIYAVWSTSLADRGRYYSDSSDGGKTWSPAHRLVATMGAVLEPERDRLTKDNNGRVYWILSDLSPLGTVDRFTSRLENGWEPVRSLELPFVYPNQDTGELRGAVVQVRNGNLLEIALLENLPNEKNARIWHLSRLLKAPPTAPQMFASPWQPVAVGTKSPHPTIVPIHETETATKAVPTEFTPHQVSNEKKPLISLLSPIVSGIAASGLLVVAVFVMLSYLRRRARRYYRRF